MNIKFNYDFEKFRIKNSTKVKAVIKKIAEDNKKELHEIVYVFTDDESLLKINREFLKHNYFTDIITFDYSDKSFISGEIYISVPTVKENSEIYGRKFINECNRVIFHGVLHLCGYNDHTDEEKKVMRSLEDRYLNYLEKNEF